MPHLNPPEQMRDPCSLNQAIVDASKQLDLKADDLMSILNVDEPFARDLLNGNDTLLENFEALSSARYLPPLLHSLLSLVGNDVTLARGWVQTANHAFEGQKPIEVMKQADGMARICAYLDARLRYG